MALPGGHGNTSPMLTLLLLLVLNLCDVGHSTLLHSNRLLASKIRDAPLTAGTNSENTQTVAASSGANSENVPVVNSVPLEGCLKLFNTGNIPLDDADVHSLKMAVSFTFDVPLEEIKLTPVGPAIVATSLLIQTKSEERMLGSDDDDDEDEDCDDDVPTREEEEDFADEAEFKKISDGNRFDAVRKLPIILPLAKDVEENALPLPQVASAAETASALAAAAAAVTAAPQVAAQVVAVVAATTAAPVAATVVPAAATAAPVALAATVAPAAPAAPAAVTAAPAAVTVAPAVVTVAPAAVTVAPVTAAPTTAAPDAMPTATIQFKLPGGQKNADRQNQLAQNPIDLFQMFSTVGLSSLLSVQVVQQC